MRTARAEAPRTIVFVDGEGWDSFHQVASALKRRGFRTVRVATSPPPRAPGLRWAADRLFYNEIINVSAPNGRERLHSLLDAGDVADVLANETTLLTIGFETSIGRELTRRSLAFSGTPPAVMLNKFAVNSALAQAGVGVPRQMLAAETPSSAAARELGLPLVIKQPIGNAGDGVRVAHSLAEIDTRLDELGGADEPLFYQEHIQGPVVVYASVVGDDGPLIEHVFRVECTQYDRGPAAVALLYDAPGVLAAGRRAAEIFGLRGFASFGFIEAEDGRFLHIDANIRPWGMIAAPLQLGIDFAEAYAAMMGGATRGRSAPNRGSSKEFPVFPHHLFEAIRSGNLRQGLSSGATLFRTHARSLGARYCAHVAGRALQLYWRRLVPMG